METISLIIAIAHAGRANRMNGNQNYTNNNIDVMFSVFSLSVCILAICLFASSFGAAWTAPLTLYTNRRRSQRTINDDNDAVLLWQQQIDMEWCDGFIWSANWLDGRSHGTHIAQPKSTHIYYICIVVRLICLSCELHAQTHRSHLMSRHFCSLAFTHILTETLFIALIPIDSRTASVLAIYIVGTHAHDDSSKFTLAKKASLQSFHTVTQILLSKLLYDHRVEAKQTFGASLSGTYTYMKRARISNQPKITFTWKQLFYFFPGIFLSFVYARVREQSVCKRKL